MTDATDYILILEDDADVAFAAQMLLRRHVGKVQVLSHPTGLPALLAERVPDLVLLDFNFAPGKIDGAEGLQVLAHLRALADPPAVIAMTAYADVPLAVQALKLGAHDFITKPWDNARLLAAIEQALVQRRRAGMNANTVDNNALSALLGDSAEMQALRNMIRSVAPTEANVMILGENGVGKELVARALHSLSPRAAHGMLTVDMGALPETTFESELFGHHKGAFTDAKSKRLGRFQAARGGSLFLDEIGNLPLAAQAKLLTALEKREVTPMGADRAEAIDVRIISATNLAEASLFDPAVFRSDLLFRLNTIVLRVPALRERSADIAQLLPYYLAHYQRQYQKPARECAVGVLASLSALPWPGNVRALRHACERAVILAQGEQYQLNDFSTDLPRNLMPAPTADMADTTDTAGAAITGAPLPGLPKEGQTLEQLERMAIEQALAQVQGNISRAAKLLGVSRAALYRKLERHDL